MTIIYDNNNHSKVNCVYISKQFENFDLKKKNQKKATNKRKGGEDNIYPNRIMTNTTMTTRTTMMSKVNKENQNNNKKVLLRFGITTTTTCTDPRHQKWHSLIIFVGVVVTVLAFVVISTTPIITISQVQSFQITTTSSTPSTRIRMLDQYINNNQQQSLNNNNHHHYVQKTTTTTTTTTTAAVSSWSSPPLYNYPRKTLTQLRSISSSLSSTTETEVPATDIYTSTNGSTTTVNELVQDEDVPKIHLDDSDFDEAAVEKKETTTTTTTSINSPRDLLKSFRSSYDDLARPGVVVDEYIKYDPKDNDLITTSLRFSYVTPSLSKTLSNGTMILEPTWNNPNIQSLQLETLPMELRPYKYHSSNTGEQQKQEQQIERPLAVYLPGLDGFGISTALYQFNDLANTFELWRLQLDNEDRTSFVDLIDIITNFVITLQQKQTSEESGTPPRPVTLIGESCGGLLATTVAIRLQNYYSSNNNTNTKEKDNHATTPVKGLVLVNPATSFDQTAWDILVPLLTSLQYLEPSTTAAASAESAETETERPLTPYALLGSLLLSVIVPDQGQLQQILTTLLSLPSLQPFPNALLSDPNKLRDIIATLQTSMMLTEERLPANLLQHRVMNWLHVGSHIVTNRLSVLENVPTLMVVGEEDKLLPSKSEAQRLKRYLKQLTVLNVPERGHFVLDTGVNLTEAIIYNEQLDPLNWWSTSTSSSSSSGKKATLGKTDKKMKWKKNKLKYDPIYDWSLPPNINEYIEDNIGPYRDAFSPIYISTDTKGKRWFGLQKIPSSNTNPILFVGNHQFLAQDMQLYLSEIYEQRGIFARGLAHPVAFLSSTLTGRRFETDLRGRTPGLVPKKKEEQSTPTPVGPNLFGFRLPLPASPTAFENFGAVMVNPTNYYKLLQSGQNVLLFPGGAAEALCGNRSYPLYWPQHRTDFVRTAARFNATIIPFSAIGMVDSYNVLLEPKDIAKLPVVGDWLKQQNQNVPAARYDTKKEDEILGFPIALPTLPQRNYYLFGTPIDTTNVDVNDNEQCTEIYHRAQQTVRDGLDDLMKAREYDPYRDPRTRIPYERFFQKQAPTFPIEKLYK